jgi:hypothetical protein
MFITYNQFIKYRYESGCQNRAVKRIYENAGGFKAFKRKYIYSNGFKDYLVSLRGSTLSAWQTYHLAKILFIYGRRHPTTIQTALNGIALTFDIKYPPCTGPLSKEYWSNKLGVI